MDAFLNEVLGEFFEEFFEDFTGRFLGNAPGKLFQEFSGRVPGWALEEISEILVSFVKALKNFLDGLKKKNLKKNHKVFLKISQEIPEGKLERIDGEHSRKFSV